MLTLTEARARRQENAKLMRVAAGGLLHLCQELDAVLAALIWKLAKKPAGEGSGGPKLRATREEVHRPVAGAQGGGRRQRS